MNPSFREILKTLNHHRVEFIVVGGVAAVIHGAPVTTFDLDALVKVSEENAKKLMRALEELEARYREHQTIIRPTARDILAGGHLLLSTRAGPLDVLGYIGTNERFEDFRDLTHDVDMSGDSFRILSLDEIIRQKRVTNREKDRAVLGLLEALARRLKSEE